MALRTVKFFPRHFNRVEDKMTATTSYPATAIVSFGNAKSFVTLRTINGLAFATLLTS
jgi:hypothetical protein